LLPPKGAIQIGADSGMHRVSRKLANVIDVIDNFQLNACLAGE